MRGGLRGMLTAGAGTLVLLLACALAYWPGLRSFPEWDDFTLLAFARLLRDPLALFAHEHFPLGPYYRPLTMALWWLSAQAFGNALPLHYALNLALHAATTVALWRVVRVFSGRSGPAWVAALAFGVHPVAIGTALWLANRFDLLAALFTLLALRACADARSGWRPLAAVRIAVYALAALASKEIGVVGVAAIGVALAWPDSNRPAAALRPARRLALVLWALAAAWFAWRLLVMRNAAETIAFGDAGAAAAVVAGIPAWLRDFTVYAGAWSWMGPAGAAPLVVALVVLVALRVRARAATDSAVRALPVAATLLIGCCVLEAPYARIWSVPFVHAAAAASIAGYARLYYLPLCALMLAATPLLAPLTVASMRPSWRRWTAGAAAVLLVVPFALGARELANAYRRQSLDKRAGIEAAVRAVAAAEVPAGAPCKFVLLGIDGSGPGYVLKTSSDSVVKALVDDVRRVERCVVLTEQAPWVSLFGGPPFAVADAAPLTPMWGPAGPVPWNRVGGVEIAYLNVGPQVDARGLRDAIFLQRDPSGFVDVSAAVADGRQAVTFVCPRNPQQCRHGDTD